MELERRSGVFCHVTSLSGPHGIGDLGTGAHAFLDWLDRADQSCWQCCPLGPTSGAHGHSPYAARSAFAGNPLLVDLRQLAARGWLAPGELEPPDAVADESVEYDAVASFTRDRLERAAGRFLADDPVEGGTDAPEHAADVDLSIPDAVGERAAPTGTIDPADPIDPAAFAAFREREADWLADYALFAALKAEQDGAAWTEWPVPVRDREPAALAGARERLADRVDYHAFVQWRFAAQWRRLRAAAAERDVAIVGDVPFYVALDSADVWANRELFALADGEPTAVAGVPPNPGDDGQRWGMPVYDWDALAATEYRWWRDRLGHLLERVDIARLDHFRAFDRFWAIPADAADPAAGEWREGPGDALFAALAEDLGGGVGTDGAGTDGTDRDASPTADLPFLVEDLGFVDERSAALRRRFGLPGMRVPQYADWCAQHHRDKPADVPTDAVAYTSTHDTDTAVGYYRSLDDRQRSCLEYALGTAGTDVAWDLIDAVWHSAAALAMTTVPDLLGLGSAARLNTPGTAAGNWQWRVEPGALDDETADRLAALTVAARR